MASDQTLRAVITVLDKTVEPIARINERFRGMQAPLRELSARVSQFAEETGLKSIGEHAATAFEHVKKLGESLAEMAGPLAALGAAGSVAGLVEMAKSTAEFAEKLDLAAGMTGLSTEQLAGFQYAAQRANVDVGQFDRGLTYLNRNIALAASGKAKDVQAILGHMGLHNTAGHMVGTADALKAVSAEVQHLVQGGHLQLATAMLAKLFGARQGAELMPVFEQGPKGLAKAMADAKEAGISMTSSQAEAGRKFMDQWKGMTASVEGLKIAIGNDLLPVLTPIVRGMRDWLNANRAWIAQGLGHAVRGLAKDIRQIDWTSVKQDLHTVGTDAKWAIDKMGGLKRAIEIVAVLSIGPTILEFSRFGGVIAATAAKLIAFPVAGFIGSLATLVPTIGSLKDAWAALNLAMDANPFGAAIVGAALVGGAAYEVYEHWDWLKKKAGAIWNWFEHNEWAQGVVALVAPVIGLPLEIYNHWKPITAFFKKLWGDVESVFAWGWKKLQPIVHAFQDAGSLISRLVGGGSAPATGNSGVVIDPTTGLPIQTFGRQAPLPAVPGARAAAGAPAQAAQHGETKMTVDFRNLPPGTTVATQSRGNAAPPAVNLGWSMPF